MMDEAIQNVFDGGEKSNSSQNILITKKGESEKTIIVGAHYDSAGTHGVDDNGSGVSVALENALRMVNTPTYYTIQYVFSVQKNRECMAQGHTLNHFPKRKEKILY